MQDFKLCGRKNLRELAADLSRGLSEMAGTVLSSGRSLISHMAERGK